MIMIWRKQAQDKITWHLLYFNTALYFDDFLLQKHDINTDSGYKRVRIRQAADHRRWMIGLSTPIRSKSYVTGSLCCKSGRIRTWSGYDLWKTPDPDLALYKFCNNFWSKKCYLLTSFKSYLWTEKITYVCF
jgi:hypothetical protein